MSQGKRDNFDDLPILTELGELLERHFISVENTARASDQKWPTGGADARSADARWLRARRRLSTTAEGVPVALSVLVTVVIAVVALTVVRHAPSRAVRQPAGAGNTYPRFPISRAERRNTSSARDG